jgi:eukaryotic-like serine/threonine-protein kinase
MIGHVLGGRYDVLDRVGGGGMALVYKGYDQLLHRKVAIKVLRQQYVHDEEFIRRFRREAQAAASLSHANVVSIYDVGQEDEVHYIVMEYIEGSTLNDVIKEKSPLQVETAINIASQICDALEHAHQNQIIHRDIKPHNILIGKNGRVKVTDFGIARAADSSQITQTGSVVGSVHYFSPEHAKGTLTGAKSDLYSLGIVLYQMLTGQLPFFGESPISVALKHLQEDVEEPRKVNPLIPQSVENIILKAMRKKPDERYQSARQMQDDLEKCLLPERRNEQKVVFDDADDAERTRVMPAIRPGQYGADDDDDDEGTGRMARVASAPKKRKHRWIAPVVMLLLSAGLLLGGWYGIQWVKDSIRVPEVEVPSFVGKPSEEAVEMLKELQMEPVVKEEFDPEVPQGIVISQDIFGMKKKIHSTIELRVSKGLEMQTMPSYVGKTYKEAELELLSTLGLKKEQVQRTEIFYDEPADQIVQQTPASGESYDPKTVSVTLTVSKGRETFEMPNLIGLSEAEAKAKITLNNLKLQEVVKEPSLKQPAGKVFNQWPFDPNAQVSRGQEIKIYVSTGLPEDSGEVRVSIPVQPAKEGEDSLIRIIITDAQYDNFEYMSKTIKKAETIDVKVVVTKDKNAVIQVRADNQLVNSRTVTYKDYQGSRNTPPGVSTGNGAAGGTGTGSADTPSSIPAAGGNRGTTEPKPPGGG